MLIVFPFRHSSKTSLIPYTTLFRSRARQPRGGCRRRHHDRLQHTDRSGEYACCCARRVAVSQGAKVGDGGGRSNTRSEEHTSELQSLAYLVCRLLLV